MGQTTGLSDPVHLRVHFPGSRIGLAIGPISLSIGRTAPPAGFIARFRLMGLAGLIQILDSLAPGKGVLHRGKDLPIASGPT